MSGKPPAARWVLGGSGILAIAVLAAAIVLHGRIFEEWEIRRLRSAEAEVRARAASFLAARGGPRAVEALAKAAREGRLPADDEALVIPPRIFRELAAAAGGRLALLEGTVGGPLKNTGDLSAWVLDLQEAPDVEGPVLFTSYRDGQDGATGVLEGIRLERVMWLGGALGAETAKIRDGDRIIGVAPSRTEPPR
jgi:hypothetical protein